MTMRTFTARQLIVDARRVFYGGGIVVDGEGRVAAILESGDEVRRRASGEVCDLGEGVLAPGWVDAHAHLELTGLEGRVEPGEVFPDWIKALLKERADLEDADFDAAVRSGADRLLGGGTTTVGDVDSSGAGARVLAQHPLRAVVLREALDVGDAERAVEAMATLRTPLEEGAGVTEGLSPHAGYTVSDALLRELGRLVGSRRIPVQVHWNETEEEARWERSSPSDFDGLVPESSGTPTLARLDAAGLLRAPVSLVHANHPAEGDAQLLYERGVVVVHCPGAHAWFDRDPFDLRGWSGAGVEVALGTDSLAGNASLDMGREVALFREAHPDVSPADIFEMATRTPARALGLDGQVGALCVGAYADLVLHTGEGDAFEALTCGESTVERVCIGGAEVLLGAERAL